MCTSQYGIPITKNPIFLQNFKNENDGLIEHSQELHKVGDHFESNDIYNYLSNK